MRVTPKLMSDNALLDVNRSLNQMLALQKNLSSGVRVNAPSDDPLASHDILNYQIDISKAEQYIDNIETGESVLNLTSSSLQEISDLVKRVKQLTISQMDSTADETTRQGAAFEVEQLLTSIVQIANKEIGNNFLFGGTQSKEIPFEILGNSVKYNGNDEALEIKIASNTSTAITLSGHRAFDAMDARVEGDIDLDPAILVAAGAGEVSTKLSQLNDGQGVSDGRFQVQVIGGANAGTYRIDTTNVESLEDLKDQIENVIPGSTLGENALRNGLQLQVAGAANINITEVANGKVASELGVLGSVVGNTVNGSDVDPVVSRYTRLTDLYIDTPPGFYDSGNAAHTAGFVITNGNKSATISLAGLTTVQDLLNTINNADIDAIAEIDSNNNLNIISRISGQNLKIVENGGSTADMFGILVDVKMSSKLDELLNGSGVGDGTINVAWSGNPGGQNVDLSGVETLAEVRNLIQALDPANLTVDILNGTSLRVTDAGGPGSLVITDVAGRFAAETGLTNAEVGGVITGNNLDPVIISENMFTAISRILTALQTNSPDSMDDALNDLDASYSTLLGALSEAGARSKSLLATKTRLDDGIFNSTELLSETWDTDYVETIMQFNTRQNAFQAALQVSAQVLPLSLVDFL